MLETKKFKELQVVELLEDLPEYDVAKGEIGTVVEVFDNPSEAYDLEFVAESGRSSKFAYSVRPTQIRSVSERDKEVRDIGSSTSARKVALNDIVEVVEDLPEYGIKCGERGAVVEVLDSPSEAYILEFVDEDGSSRLAYWVSPEQIRTLDAVANELFERGVALFDHGRLREAEGALQRAIEMKASLLRDLHSLIVERADATAEQQTAFDALRFLVRIAPDYEGARTDLAKTYMMRGMELANQNKIEQAIYFFDGALGAGPPAAVVSRIRSDLATAYTRLGVAANDETHYQRALQLMRLACEIESTEVSRRNLGLAHALLATNLLANAEYGEAAEQFERAIDAGYINSFVLNNYGVAQASKGKFDLAVTEFKRALRLDPGNEGIQANLAKAEAEPEPGESAFDAFPISDRFRVERGLAA